MVFAVTRPVFLVALCALASSCSAGPDAPSARVRSIILASRQIGPHGIGYGERSLTGLSRRLTTADVPVLISLLPDRALSVGVQFALASQCEHAISPVREAAATHKMGVLEASNVMTLISSFEGCSSQARSQAKAALAQLDTLRQDEQAAAKQRAEERALDDARVQQNGVRMIQGSKQARGLSRDEREEVFRRSLHAMGLSENGPMTAQQRDLVDRMYRTMVLGEPDSPPSSNSPR
jgi:hypothetical protein